MISPPVSELGAVAALEETRARTLALVSNVDERDLSRVVTPLLSPLLWDLGHIANFEQRWLLAGADGRLDGVYDPFRNPRVRRGDLPFLRASECFAYMERVRALVGELSEEPDRWLVELVIQHEQQHNETMLQLLRLLEGDPASGLRRDPPRAEADARLAWTRIPNGRYELGSGEDETSDFVYDNERGVHEVELDAFEIASRPVTNGEWREWLDAGGYRRPEWWSADGRRWLAAERPDAPLGWLRAGAGEFLETGFGEPRVLHDGAPVCHVSWYEADAYARSIGARLPTEAEWEVAASFDVETGRRPRNPWEGGDWSPAAANLDQLEFGTRPCGGGARSPAGLSETLGQVWEWTSSTFAPYPGFEPFAYERYSRPFFSGDYRVLRGGSWATRPRTISNRFRNWDLPQRRQIFSGLRLARTVEGQ